MNTNGITPLPWAMEIDSESEKIYINSPGVVNQGQKTNGQNWVCSLSIPKSGELYAFGHARRMMRDYDQAKANAAYIVRACNAYPALLEACKAVLTMSAYLSGPSIGEEIVRKVADAIAKAEA